MTILLPALVALIGLIVYLVAINPKAQELGRIAYAMGLLVTLAEVAGHVVSLLGK